MGALVSDRKAYRYLPRSTAYLPPATVISEMLVTAGFTAVNHREILGGLSQRFIATRRT
jgi:demethylmenaquinone methyltransferase/2-methoxy-6-polyprenyl-1,4-benzoquinol methylase